MILYTWYLYVLWVSVVSLIFSDELWVDFKCKFRMSRCLWIAWVSGTASVPPTHWFRIKRAYMHYRRLSVKRMPEKVSKKFFVISSNWLSSFVPKMTNNRPKQSRHFVFNRYLRYFIRCFFVIVISFETLLKGACFVLKLGVGLSIPHLIFNEGCRLYAHRWVHKIELVFWSKMKFKMRSFNRNCALILLGL